MTAAAESRRRVSLLDALGQLPWREQFLLRWRYGIESARLTEAEIAESLDIDADEVAEKERQALQALGLYLVVATGTFDAAEDRL